MDSHLPLASPEQQCGYTAGPHPDVDIGVTIASAEQYQTRGFMVMSAKTLLGNLCTAVT